MRNAAGELGNSTVKLSGKLTGGYYNNCDTISFLEALNNRNGKGIGLTGAGMGGCYDILSLKCGRKYGLLDWRRYDKIGFVRLAWSCVERGSSANVIW